MKPKHEVALDVLKRRDQKLSVVTLRSGRVARVWNVAWGYDLGDSVAHVTTNSSPEPEGEHSIDFFRADEIVRIEDPQGPSVLFNINRCPRFRARLKFHFREHGPDRRRWFLFGEDLCRQVPMKIDGVDGLNTVSMWATREGPFHEGDSVEVDCDMIVDSLLGHLTSGTNFQLWDGGFYATGVVLKELEAERG